MTCLNTESVGVDLLETTIKFRVTNIEQLQDTSYGPSIKVGSTCFQPYVKPFENTEGRYTTLGIFLECTDSQNWKGNEGYHVEMQFKLCSQPGHDPYSKILKTSRTFDATSGTDWGYKALIAWWSLIHPCWMEDGAILIEVVLKIEKISGSKSTTLETAESDVCFDVDQQKATENEEKDKNRESCCPGYSQLALKMQELQELQKTTAEQLTQHIMSFVVKSESSSPILDQKQEEVAATEIETVPTVTVVETTTDNFNDDDIKAPNQDLNETRMNNDESIIEANNTFDDEESSEDDESENDFELCA